MLNWQNDIGDFISDIHKRIVTTQNVFVDIYKKIVNGVQNSLQVMSISILL